MADEEPKEGEVPVEAAPKKKGKLLIIIIIAVVLLVAGGGGAFFFLKKSGGGEGKDAKKEADKKAEEVVMYPIDPFVVNLSDQGGNKFLKVTLQLELANAGPQTAEKTKLKNPQLRDAIITLLTSKSAETLVSPEGKLQLKDEISVRTNQILGENAVKNVYLTEFVMQ
ncbi:MAG: flagellar basal body-associated FliL family protein [Nitrospirae bacterium]|nr:MAG: flagellar basal body-associated FliL family protein [Nitrospirota bacterium]